MRRSKAELRKFRVLAENNRQYSSRDEALIVNVTVSYENRPEAFEAARQAKIEKYAPVVESLKGRFRKVTVEPVVVGQWGSWDPTNDGLPKRLCTKTYAGLMKKLIVSGVIRWYRVYGIDQAGGESEGEDPPHPIPP
jgi:hypothetical protein